MTILTTEKQIENELVRRLQKPSSRFSLTIENSSNHNYRNLSDLIGNADIDIIQDDSEWNTHPGFMVDIAGGMTPDIVIRSKLSKQNRIYIEVKNDAKFNYGLADSQMTRCFLHLLATSTREQSNNDPCRALILAAPSTWFAIQGNKEKWSYFKTHDVGLADAFGITIGELWVDAFIES